MQREGLLRLRSLAANLGLSLATGGKLTPIRGGLPLNVGGQCVGGIGVSAGSEDEDVQVAQAGVDALATPGRPLATVLLLSFLPPLFTAALILLVGWLVANFLSQGVLIAAVNARLPEARLVARGVYWSVVLFSVATALTHVGIGKEMVLVAFGITFGGLVFALALAFGLGGRAVARHIIERRLRRESPPPQERITQL